MKVLIWIGCFILNYIISPILRAIVLCIPTSDDGGAILVGTLSGLVSAASLGLCIWLAIRLCKKLDLYRAMKKAAEAGMTVSEYGRHGLSEEFLEQLASLSKKRPIEEVELQLKACVKKGMITKEQYTILLNEYCNKK